MPDAKDPLAVTEDFWFKAYIEEGKPPSAYISNPYACFFTRAGFDGSTYWNTLYGDRYVTCDCHRLGTCSHGEPVPPLSAEWENDPAYNYTGPPIAKYPFLRDSHRYSTVREGAGIVAPPSKRGIYRRRDNATESLVPGHMTHQQMVLKAYQQLDKDAKRSVLVQFGTVKPYLMKPSLDLEKGHHVYDPRGILGILLSNPGPLAGSAVLSMSTRELNLLFLCTDMAVKVATRKLVPKTINKGNKEDWPMRADYHNNFVRFATYWQTHTPPGISREWNGTEQFNYTTMDAGDTTLHQTISSKDICEDVWDRAKDVLEDEGDPSFVSSIEDSLNDIRDMVDSAGSNSYLDSIEPSVSWEPMEKLDWSSQKYGTLEDAVKGSKGGMQIVTAYIALTMWTGHPQWNHTLGA